MSDKTAKEILKQYASFHEGIVGVSPWPSTPTVSGRPEDILRAMTEFADQEKRSTAIAFQEWIAENDLIRSADGFWYEPPMYVYEGRYGKCVAISTAALYDLYINSLPKTV